MSFRLFFIECSLRESAQFKTLFELLALDSGGGVVINRNNTEYLSLEEGKEFKIPKNYSAREHRALKELLTSTQSQPSLSAKSLRAIVFIWVLVWAVTNKVIVFT